jgi:hypothetical protein
MKIINLDKQCEDRCIVGVIKDIDENGFIIDTIVYDSDTIVTDDDRRFVQFNFCPACGQELECKINPHSVKIERVIR